MAKLLAGSTIDGNVIWHDGATDSREAFFAYQAVNQRFQSQTWTKMLFDRVAFDKLGGWDSVKQEYTVKKGGLYLVSSGVNWYNHSGSGVRTVLDVSKNNNSLVWTAQTHASAPKDFSTAGNAIIECVAGDILGTQVWHDHTSTMDTMVIATPTGVNASTFFAITKLS